MDTTTDVVVVGGGAAGLFAAARLREAGRAVVVVEASELLGGSTATDTGQFWLPATHLASRLGGADAPEDALAYLDAILGDPTPSSSAVRRQAFVRSADDVARWMDGTKFGLAPVKGRVDFHPEATGARRGGRSLMAQPFDRRLLGPLGPLLRDLNYDLEIAPRSPRGVVTAASVLARRLLTPTKDLVSGGAALAGRLLLRASMLGAKLWTASEFVDLVTEAGRVTGVRVRRDGREVELAAREGVILACGGFEGNDDMRRDYLPLPTDAAWTSGLDTNTGAGIRAAAALGATLAEMDEAWWTLVARFGGKTYRMTSERTLPHGIVVDRAGDRFFDEAGPVPEVGRALYDRNRRVRAIPSFLIVDSRHRQHYRMGPWLPGSHPGADNDAIVRAQSLADLAAALKIDTAGLLGTVVRFNGLAAKGSDSDFRRGASPVDRAHGDPLNRKNPCLGTLEKSPYWAVPLYPGDAGTKGGVLVDADARVLSADGPIPGLYAVSGVAASLFKDTSPGVGAAVASGLVEAHRAVTHLTGEAVPRG